MKKLFSISILLLLSVNLFSRPQIKKLSSFRIQDETEIREKPDFNSEPQYQTLNHENGLQVKVLQKGKWLYESLIIYFIFLYSISFGIFLM